MGTENLVQAACCVAKDLGDLNRCKIRRQPQTAKTTSLTNRSKRNDLPCEKIISIDDWCFLKNRLVDRFAGVRACFANVAKLVAESLRNIKLPAISWAGNQKEA